MLSVLTKQACTRTAVLVRLSRIDRVGVRLRACEASGSAPKSMKGGRADGGLCAELLLHYARRGRPQFGDLVHYI